MATERERKFLVAGSGWTTASVRHIRQGYLPIEGGSQVRVRLVDQAHARLTIKDAAVGLERQEFEYPIPVEDARLLLDTLCRSALVEKRRHLVEHAGHTWEVDVFAGANDGLILAEIELPAADTEFAAPPWLGPEVTGDPRYGNVHLARHPFSSWTDSDPHSGNLR